MKARYVALLGLILTSGLAQSAPMFRWVDAQGNVHYTDSPPPQEAKSSEEKKFVTGAPTVALPYGLQQAVKLYPVTLYATTKDCGEPCDAARKLLERRGIPHTEKDARDEAVQEELKKLTGGNLEVPVLKVGKTVSKGYLESSWNNALDAANYPKISVLPRNYAASNKPGDKNPKDGKSEGGNAKADGNKSQVAAGPKDTDKAPATSANKPAK